MKHETELGKGVFRKKSRSPFRQMFRKRARSSRSVRRGTLPGERRQNKGDGTDGRRGGRGKKAILKRGTEETGEGTRSKGSSSNRRSNQKEIYSGHGGA